MILIVSFSGTGVTQISHQAHLYLWTEVNIWLDMLPKNKGVTSSHLGLLCMHGSEDEYVGIHRQYTLTHRDWLTNRHTHFHILNLFRIETLIHSVFYSQELRYLRQRIAFLCQEYIRGLSVRGLNSCSTIIHFHLKCMVQSILSLTFAY